MAPDTTTTTASASSWRSRCEPPRHVVTGSSVVSARFPQRATGIHAVRALHSSARRIPQQGAQTSSEGCQLSNSPRPDLLVAAVSSFDFIFFRLATRPRSSQHAPLIISTCSALQGAHFISLAALSLQPFGAVAFVTSSSSFDLDLFRLGALLATPRLHSSPGAPCIYFICAAPPGVAIIASVALPSQPAFSTPMPPSSSEPPAASSPPPSPPQ